MKAVAALRNQFGGHAVTTEAADAGEVDDARRRSPDAPTPSRCTSPTCRCTTSAPTPSVEVAARRRASPRSSGRNGQGKTNLVEAIDYLSPAGLAPGRHRRAAGPARRRAGGGPRGRSCATTATRVLEVEINPGRANRARVNRSPLPRARDLLGLLRTRAVRARGPGAGQGRPGRAPPLPRRPAGAARRPRLAGVRADYDRVLKQRNALLKTAGAAARRARPGVGTLRTLEVWDAHLAAAGAELLAGAARAGRRRCGRWSARPTRRSARGAPPRRADDRATGSSFEALPERPADRDDARARRCSRELARAPRATSSTAGVTLVGPHRDDLVLLGLGDRCRPRATPATASPGRSRWRCGWRRTTCCAPTAASRCWSSTTSSPSSTPTAGSGWPSWSPAPSRCWSPPRCRRRARRRCAGRRVRRGRRGGDP